MIFYNTGLHAINSKRYFIYTLLAIVISFSLNLFALSTNKASAAAVIGWIPGRIIDDSIFTNKKSMSLDQIQSFLNSKVPICDNWGTNGSTPTSRRDFMTSYGYALPLTCLKDYTENGLSAAQIIYNASQTYSINPQVLIVLLQKEQGLVTDDWPAENQYRSATGYGCPDTAPCDTQYYGLTNQITWSAKMFRAIMDVSPTWYTPYLTGNNFIQYNPNSSCGGSVVNIQNRATQALYNYTPYQPNQSTLDAGWGSVSCGAYGNRNFFLYFTQWFGTTLTGNHPSPLYKSVTSGLTYAIIEDLKYLIPSFDIMVNYGFNKLPVTEVSDNFLLSFTDATPLTGMGRKQYDESGAIYLFDDGKEYHVKSEKQCIDWGLDCFNPEVTKILKNSLLDRYIAYGGQLPDTVRNGSDIYSMQNGKKKPIVGNISTNSYRGLESPIFKDQNVLQPMGSAIIDDRYIIKFGDTPTIYLHDRGMLHSIENLSDLTDWGLYSLSGSNVPSFYDTDPLPRVDPLRPIAKSLDEKLYIINKGVRFSLLDRSKDFSNQPFTSFTYPDSQLDRLPTAKLPDVLRAESTGEIFTVSDNKKRVFATIDDIKNLGFNLELTTNIPQSIADNLGYSGLNLPQGKLYKVIGTDEIRIRYNDGYKYVGSLSYNSLNYLSTINVDIETGNLYGYLGEYRP